MSRKVTASYLRRLIREEIAKIVENQEKNKVVQLTVTQIGRKYTAKFKDDRGNEETIVFMEASPDDYGPQAEWGINNILDKRGSGMVYDSDLATKEYNSSDATREMQARWKAAGFSAY
tara:strand:+ start:220 stop:573 length:354 start_codon:yes stop_codon:yes gene_type:complete